MAGAYLLLIALTVAISLARLQGYDMTLSDWSLAAYRRLSPVDVWALATSLAIAVPTALLCMLAALSTISLLFWQRREGLVAVLMLPGFLCCPALRAVALPTLTGRVTGSVDFVAGQAISMALGFLCLGATAFPLCLAICLLGASGRMARYLEIYRNLGGSAGGVLRAVTLPVLRSSATASFLVATPVIAFDPYALRVAGGQVLPSVGALLTDLRSASDWPLIAVVCLLSLLLLVPIYALLLPATTRSAADD